MMLFQIYAGKGSFLKIYCFRNLLTKNVPFSCEREAYPSHYFPFSNVPASCECSLNGVKVFCPLRSHSFCSFVPGPRKALGGPG